MSAVWIFVFFFTAAWAIAAGRRKSDIRRLEQCLAQSDSRAQRLQVAGLLGPPPYVEFVAGHAIVRLDVLRRRSRPLATRLRASFTYSRGPRFQIAKRDAMLSYFARRLGAQDVPLGDHAFDDAFVVKCHDVEATRRYVTPRARRLMRSSRAAPRVISDGTSVTLVLDRVIQASAALDAAIELVAEIASCDAREMADYARVPGVELREPKLDPPRRFHCVMPTKAGDIELQPHGTGGLSLSLTHTGSLPDVEVVLARDKTRGAPPELSRADLAPLIASLSDATLTNRGDRLTLEWEREPPSGGLSRAAELLQQIVAPRPTSGAFR